MVKKFLIGQLACFGDCLYATTVAKQIKHDYPDSHITWAIAAKYKSILELNPYIDDIREVPTEDFTGEGWRKFEEEAEADRAKNVFDQIFYTQVHHRNLDRFYSTLRKTVFGLYNRPITVDISPVIRLTEKEVENVRLFAEKHRLENFKNVFLFECAPGSGQSKVNPEFAVKIAQTITKNRRDTCFILSTPQKLNFENPQIISAAELTFRENAELTKFCTMLIGCSSGITWLSTSDWAKKLPMLQLLNARSKVFAGVHYDFELNGLETGEIIEMTDFDEARVAACLEAILESETSVAKPAFHQEYKPNYYSLSGIVDDLIWKKSSSGEIRRFIRKYIKENKKADNKISLKYLLLILWVYYRNSIGATETGFFFRLRRFIKTSIWEKSH